MDFIERWLQISPDGGNGTVEAAYLAAGMVFVLAIAFHKSLLRKLARQSTGRTGADAGSRP